MAYESSSGGILDTIADMQSKAEESLSGTRKDEMEAAHAYALVKQGLEDEIKVANKQLSEATLTRSTTEEELHSAEASLSETEETLAGDTKYLEELKQSCTTKATEWAARQKQASEETAAIQKAKDILSEGVKVFLQTSSRTRLQSETEASLDARSQVVSILKKLARTENSYALAQLASQARSDPFGKIRGLIEDMIAKLLKEAQEEATQGAHSAGKMIGSVCVPYTLDHIKENTTEQCQSLRVTLLELISTRRPDCKRRVGLHVAVPRTTEQVGGKRHGWEQ